MTCVSVAHVKVCPAYAGVSSEFDIPRNDDPGDTTVFGCNRTSSRKYIVKNAATRAEAELAVYCFAPATDGVMVRRRISSTKVHTLGWISTVEYSAFAPAGLGEIEIRGTTSGGTAHVTQSLATVSSHGLNGEQPTDHQGTIGVTHGDGKDIEGTEIQVAGLSFSATVTLAPGSITCEAVELWRRLTKTKNDADWAPSDADPACVFPKGSLLLEGVDFDVGTAECETVTFNFNAVLDDDVTIAGHVITKEGHDYMWVEYARTKDDTSGRMAQIPVSAYVEQVYHAGNFSLLGI